MNTSDVVPKKPSFGGYLKLARANAGFTQSQLAKRVGVTRLIITRIEIGFSDPDFALAVRLAAALDEPLEWFVSGRRRPSRSLRGLTVELRRLGVSDLAVSDPRPPGAFRPAEEVIALALRGDRPSPRIVDAMPFVLTRREFDPHLLLAFARRSDPRVRRRLGWLADVSLVLAQRSDFPPVESTAGLERLVRLVGRPKPADPEDGLGHPGTGRPPLVWRRWRVSYAGTLDGFVARATGLHDRPEG